MNCILQGNCTICPTVLGYGLCMVPKGEPLFTSLLLFQNTQTSKMPGFRTKTYPSKPYNFICFNCVIPPVDTKLKADKLFYFQVQDNQHNAQSTSIQNNAITLHQILLGLPKSHLNASSAACHVFILFQSHYVFDAVCNYYGDCVLQYHTQR